MQPVFQFAMSTCVTKTFELTGSVRALEIIFPFLNNQQKYYITVVSSLEISYGRHYLKQVYQSQPKTSLQDNSESVHEFLVIYWRNRYP